MESFWFNTDTGLVHTSNCGHCGMKATGFTKWKDTNRDAWWGPYATIGAAVDAVRNIDRGLSGCQACLSNVLKDWRSTTSHS